MNASGPGSTVGRLPASHCLISGMFDGYCDTDFIRRFFLFRRIAHYTGPTPRPLAPPLTVHTPSHQEFLC